MKHTFLFLAFLALTALSSCGISYDGETRLISQLHVVDSQGNPIPDLNVSVYVQDDEDDDNDFDDNSNPANGKTDGNGNSLIGFLAPEKSNAKIRISIEGDSADEFLSSEISNLRKSDFVNFKLPVSEVTLYRPQEVVELQIVFEQTTNTDFVSADVNGDFTTKRFNGYFNNPQQTVISLRARKNQTVFVNYIVADASSGEPTQLATQIEIGNENVSTTIGY